MLSSIILSLLTIVLASAQSDPAPTIPVSQATTTDYNYALRYLGLEEYKTHKVAPNGGGQNAVIYSAPDQQGYMSYITYTTDGNNVYQTTVRVKPGTYPIISSTPIKSKPIDPQTYMGTSDDSSQSQQSQHENNHPLEDTMPMNFPYIEGIPEDIPDATTLTPNTDDANEDSISSQESMRELPEKEDGEVSERDSKEDTDNSIPAGNVNLNVNNRSPVNAKIITQYMRSPYGTFAYYPVAYNPYTGQKTLIARPVTVSSSAQLMPIPSTAATPGDKTTKAQTFKPSSAPGGITTTRPSSFSTSGPSVRVPVSYVYPYVNYQSQNGMVYQVPAQQLTTIQQYIRWVQAQSRYQSAYPQGYVSYQPAVLAMRSPLPSGHNVQPKMSITQPTAPTLDNSEEQ